MLAVIPLIIWWRTKQRNAQDLVAIDVPMLAKTRQVTWRVQLYKLIEPLFWLGIVFLIVAMARPQAEHSEEIIQGRVSISFW